MVSLTVLATLHNVDASTAKEAAHGRADRGAAPETRRRACPACRSGSRRTGSPKPGTSRTMGSGRDPVDAGRVQGWSALSRLRPAHLGWARGLARQGDFAPDASGAGRIRSEESRFRELHADCRSHRWGTANSATMHCGYCCPPPPMSPARFEKAMRLFESFGKPDPSQLDEWELSLTCDHTTRRTQHRSNGTRSSWYVVDCPECGTTRGVVESRLQGPAVDPEERPVVERERLEAELRLRRGQARPATLSRRESSAGCRRPPDSIKRAPRMMTTTPSSPKCWPSSQTPSAAHLGASSLFCRPD